MERRGVAVFVSMEILLDGLPTYAGGLGILAGDMLLSAAELGYPLIGVTLLHERGYVYHEVRGREVLDMEERYDPMEHHKRLDVKLRLDLKSGPIYLGVWRHNITGRNGGIVPVYLLDSNMPENPPPLRGLTSRVYIEDSLEERLLKRLILSLGTLELMEKLGVPVAKYHVNESHGGFLAIELLGRYGLSGAREKLVFTTHTPLVYGHEEYEYGLVEKFYDVPPKVKELSPDRLRLTRVMMQLAGYYNCVSWKFRRVHMLMFPGFKPDSITNGVHHERWTHYRVQELYDKYVPGWRREPFRLATATSIPLREVEQVKLECKRELAEYVNTRGVVERDFDASAFTMGARRRMTGYKRVALVLADQERIEALAKKFNIQVVFSGVSHPQDVEGRREIARILDAMSTYSHLKVAFISRRGVELEKLLAAGTDLWLHTPRPPLEACGTSWMRAALNLTPSLASRDGGVLEAIVDGYNGWLFGSNALSPGEKLDDAGDLEEMYSKLEEILSLSAAERDSYLLAALRIAAAVGSLFNTHRMVKEYALRAYGFSTAGA